MRKKKKLKLKENPQQQELEQIYICGSSSKNYFSSHKTMETTFIGWIDKRESLR